MFAVVVILAIVTGGFFLMVGATKIIGVPMMEKNREHLGLASGLWKAIGGLEVLGAAGLLLGLHQDLPVIGVLAGVGLVGMTIGAVFYHQQAGDAMKDWIVAVAVGSVTIIYIILRIGTA